MNSDITDLIIAMIDTHSEYGDVLNFKKSDIDKIIAKYNFLDNINFLECNELGWIVLYKNKYITGEQFAKHMDVEYIDVHFYIVADSFDDILSKDYETEISALDWDDDWWNNYSEYYDADVPSYWRDYTDETLKEIIKFCIKNKIEIEGELMDENNTLMKNGKVYFKDTELVDMIGDDELDELKRALNSAINDAQESADRDHVYNTIKKAFVDSIGPFERKMVKITNSKKEETQVEKIYVRLDFDMKEVEKFLEYEYNKYNFTDETYGNLVQILKEMEFFDFKAPNYDYIGSGDIDDEYLNEMTRDRLNW